MRGTREVTRDDRDFDRTCLKAKFHGTNLHRDYTAHFFRWSFAKRFISPKDNVLEVGCGVEKPLSQILLKNQLQLVNHYTGVDLNLLSPTGAGKRAEFIGNFNFVKDFKKLRQLDPSCDEHGGYDVVIHLEVIEHMRVDLGRKMLKACLELLRPGGVMLMSTPCYDGKRHAANHIHEYTVPELQKMVEKVGFEVVRRFGTFMDVPSLKAGGKAMRELRQSNPDLAKSVLDVFQNLGEYYSNDALSCFFAPMFPDYARNNLWLCRKEG